VLGRRLLSFCFLAKVHNQIVLKRQILLTLLMPKQEVSEIPWLSSIAYFKKCFDSLVIQSDHQINSSLKLARKMPRIQVSYNHHFPKLLNLLNKHQENQVPRLSIISDSILVQAI